MGPLFLYVSELDGCPLSNCCSRWLLISTDCPFESLIGNVHVHWSVTERSNQPQCGMKAYRWVSVQNSVTHSCLTHRQSSLIECHSISDLLLLFLKVKSNWLPAFGRCGCSVKSTIWLLLQCKDKRQAAEQVRDHKLNLSRDTRGKERRGWEATQRAR